MHTVDVPVAKHYIFSSRRPSAPMNSPNKMNKIPPYFSLDLAFL